MQPAGPKKLFTFKPSCQGLPDNGFQTNGHQEIYIRPGLWMTMINFSSDRPVCLEYEKQYPVIDFGFVISGNIRKQTSRAGSAPHSPPVKSGISGVRLEKRQTGIFTIPPQAKQQILHLHMTLPFFRKVMNREYKVLPPELQGVLKGDSQAEFVNIRPMTTDIQSVVYQLLNASSNAFPWSLYLEGKSLELLSLHLAALGLDCRNPEGQLLNRTDKQKIFQARALLINDLQSPPTLNCLARTTGLNAAKLQAGFRQAYGKSVFDYFRDYRMQEARKILDTTETNVSQTAWQVGYTNVSHFSEAFKKRFGILPKHYLKNRLTDIQHSFKPT